MRFSKLFLLFALVFASCSMSVKTSSDRAAEQQNVVRSPDSDVVELTILQLNDVYEIAPVENGKYGGLSRVATVRSDLKKENPNTFTFLSGDFISPSAIGTSMFQGSRINGAQMVDAMNAVGVDFVTFGNHEFDLGYDALQSRINESRFMWISSNISYTPSQEGYVKPFDKIVNGVVQSIPESYVLPVKNAVGKEVRVGIIGLTLGNGRPPYVDWSDPFQSAQRFCNELKPKTDFIIAITHLSIEDDKKLAELQPDLKLILGGHEHTNMMFKVGETLISKADANARTVFIHRLRWTHSSQSLEIRSEVKTIGEAIAEEPATAKIVHDWITRAYDGFREKGFDPAAVVTTLNEPLDGRETAIRYRQTNLGSLIAKSMLVASKKSRVALFNSGSIRLDDELSGTVTQYDVIRTLPFGGKLLDVEMKGSLLSSALDAGLNNIGKGGYLQFAGVGYDSTRKAWAVAGKPIEPGKAYWAIVSDFLFSGREQGLEFFSKSNPDVISLNEADLSGQTDLRRDIRLAVIEYLKKGGN